MSGGAVPQGGAAAGASEIPVLVISYHFPPDTAVGGKRAARFCHYLPSFGIRPVVLTAREESYPSVDRSFPLPPGLRIERAGVLSMPGDWYVAFKGRSRRPAADGNAPQRAPTDAGSAGAPAEGDGGFLRRNALALLDFPDERWGWYWPAVRTGAGVVRRERIRAVVSSAPPWTSHLVAGRLAHRFDLPWIADFRDLWLDSRNIRGKVPRWRLRLEGSLLASWMRRASLVLCSTDASTEALAAQFPNEPPAKFVTLTGGFDGAVSAAPPAPGPKLVLHTGTLYSGRTVDTLCHAVARLIETRRVSARDFKLVFLGSKDPRIEAAARAATPELFQRGCIEFRPPVAWAEAQQALQDASVLLVVQGNHPVAIPAKFYEYLQTGKPVLALVCEGALSRMVESTGIGVWADSGDVGAIADGLEAALRMAPRSGDQLASLSRQFHYGSLTARLAEHIRTAIAERGASRGSDGRSG